VICPNCGTANEAGRKFCGECATRLVVPCPNCGTPNTPGTKFCGECGTAVSAPSAVGPAVEAPVAGAQPIHDQPVAERRLVSVLFIDLVGFTTYAEGRDAEDVRDTLTRYFALATDIIERYGGTIEKFIGDAVMAVWGAPIAREDDAERAVRAALDLVSAVRTLAPGVESRAGVLTGEAAVTMGAPNQGMVAGDLVNTASRLQSVAPPGVVLVGEATHRAASQSIAFEEAGEQTLKGKSAAIPAWRAIRVVAERGGRNRVDALEAPFVGRDEDLRLLKDLFHATARENRTRLVSVVGPAGIGKSRLAREFLIYVDGLVDTVWWHDGRCPAYGDGISFWALGEMVRGRAGLLETDDETTTRAKVAETVARHVPDAEERRWIEPALLALLGIESGADPRQLFGAWRTFFERLAASLPVVMVFEDLHFADSGLLDFIDHLLEWSRGVPIYVVTLARPELMDRRPSWGAGQRTFTSMALEPLSKASMRELLGGLVPGLPDGAVEAIVTRADGVPLYAVETVRMLLADGRIALVDGVYRPVGDLTELAVPETLTALIASRLDALDAADRILISDGAVLGQSFSLAGLSAVAGVPEGDLEPRLRVLVRRDLLTVDSDPRSPERGQYAFVQALIREVAYNTLARPERKVRHLAAARFFEALGSDELAGALAGHYVAAHENATAGAEANALAGQARLALRGAADRAAALGAHDQAVAFYGQAMAVTADPSELADLNERAAHAASTALQVEVAMQLMQRAIELHRSTGDRAREGLATASLATWQADIGHPEDAIELLERVWPEFSDLAETETGAWLMSAFARAYASSDVVEQTLLWAERALVVGERLDLMEVIVRNLHSRGAALIKENRPREGTILIGGAGELAQAHGLLDAETRARTVQTFVAQWDDPRAGLEAARAGQQLAERTGSRTLSMLMVGNGVSCAIRVGDWDWASALLDEWSAVAIPDAARVELTADGIILGALRGLDVTDLIASVGPLSVGLTDPQYESYRQLALAWHALTEGRLGATLTTARAAVEGTSYFGPMSWPLAARAALWSRDADGVRACLDELLRDAARGSALSADVLTVRAGLAGLEDRPAEALSLYRDALRAWHALGLQWDEALCAIDMATVLDPTDPEVRAATDGARATLTAIGARPFLERLGAAVRTPTGWAVPAADPFARQSRDTSREPDDAGIAT
jgi:class 3 adenylate cyclase/tetratricopeptide (TPR) repeat protein